MTTLAQSPDTRVDSVECQQTPEEQRAQGKLGLSKETRRWISAVALSVTMALAGCNSDGKVEKTSAQTPASQEVKTQMVQTEAQKPTLSWISEWVESLAKIEGSTLPVSLIELSQQHLQKVREWKVIWNQPILKFQTLDIAAASSEEKLNFIANALSHAPKKTAQELALPQLQLVKKTVNGTQIDSISVETFNDLATKVSDTTDVEKWLYVWAPKPEDRMPASADVIAKHKEEIQTILTTVWLKNVDKWDSDIVSGKLKPDFYKDLVTFINNGVQNNKFPSVESFRRIVNSSIELARGQNFPETKLGEKLYERSLSNISDALTNYLVLTQDNGYKVVKVQIWELKYSLPALTQETSLVSQKSTQAPSLFVAQLKDTQDQLIADYNNLQNKDEILALADELYRNKEELAQDKVEVNFIKEANQVQANMYARLEEYLKNPNEDTLNNIKELYAQLENLNKRVDTEFTSDPKVKQGLLALTQMCKEKIPQLASLDQGKNLITTI